jgi:hypothetical protein
MRRLISGLLALMLVVGTTGSIITPASAAYEYLEYDYFYIYKGGEPAVSDKFAKKWDDQYAPMYTHIGKYPGSSINWLSSETVYWRGRSASLARATELGTSNVETDRDLAYLSGYGTRLSEYTIAAEYASSNPYTNLEVIIYWDP